jgi:hypothetical protein
MDTQLTAGDYVLVDDNMWVQVKGFAIYIHKTDEGVVVDIFDNNFVLTGTLGSTNAFDNELALEGNPWVHEENGPIDLDGGLSATNEQDQE